MCGFIRTVEKTIKSTRHRRFPEMPFKDDYVETEEAAKEILNSSQDSTGTRWCIIYTKKEAIDMFHVRPDPRDKRNNDDTLYFKYEEEDDVNWSTYRQIASSPIKNLDHM